jgi:DNA-binding XRE family transcriptional regulator
MTQDDLALSIGVNRKVIGQLEGGKETVRLEIALNAARSLGLNVGVEARGETDS